MSFKDLSNDEEAFKDFKKKQKDDDEKVMRYFEQCNHEDFMFALSNLGVLIDTINVYSIFLRPQVVEALENLEGKSLKRKLNKFIKDLNDRIRFEYDFDDDVIIIEEAVLFEGELHLFFSKHYFIKVVGLKKISYE